MDHALCHLSIVPVRSSASDKSEQVSQLLFGEAVEILEWKGKTWAKVRCTVDNSIGWVQARQLLPLTNEEARLFTDRFAYCLDVFQPLLSDDFSIPLSLGARLPDFDGMKFALNGKTYRYSGQAVFPENLTPSADLVLKIARRFLWAPYQWGGRGPLGIDASGLVQLVFQLVGIRLPRLAEQQVHFGSLVDFIEQSVPGDLAFFENLASNITHVGILMPDEKIIHTGAYVRIDRLDHYGIFNQERGRYTHRLRVIKRLLPKTAQAVSEKKAVKSEFNQAALFV